jgi:FlaA1/EpsC-like NDP-sugar epimerase
VLGSRNSAIPPLRSKLNGGGALVAVTHPKMTFQLIIQADTVAYVGRIASVEPALD